MSIKLGHDFFARDGQLVAQDLIGKELWQTSSGIRLQITETEAYLPDDSACHCRVGVTARNAPMWGPAGHAYIYLCYGIHRMLNLVTNQEGEGAAVLIRACAPIEGHDILLQRRKMKKLSPNLLTGPGKVGQALELSLKDSGRSLTKDDWLNVWDTGSRPRLVTGPRVGIDYAAEEDKNAHLRYACEDTTWVSTPKNFSLLSR